MAVFPVLAAKCGSAEFTTQSVIVRSPAAADIDEKLLNPDASVTVLALAELFCMNGLILKPTGPLAFLVELAVES